MKRRHIYVNVNNPDRRSDCSFGADSGFDLDICVGWGSGDSHLLANIAVARHTDPDHRSNTYTMYVDGEEYAAGVHRHGEFTFTVKRFNGCELYVPFHAEVCHGY